MPDPSPAAPAPPESLEALELFLLEPLHFADANGRRLRPYQAEVLAAVVRSVLGSLGLSFVVIFPRQSGKNEVQAQLEAYLLTLFRETGTQIVKVSPTWEPQCLTAIRRLEEVLEKNKITRSTWNKEQGHIIRSGLARVFFFSGIPTSNVVGATASHLLECDEAQDVLIAKWDKDFNPMAASRNATRVFWGTAWTSQTLLARELRAAREAERQDGHKRVFLVTADDVAQVVPDYHKFVAAEIAKLGRSHPFIKTQYFCEETDSEASMFPPARRALMQGSHPRQEKPPASGRLYAFLIDVAGEETGISGQSELETPAESDRDATALTIIEVDLTTLRDDLLKAPTYRVVDRRLWVGVKHTLLFSQIRALAETWGAAKIVVDATGVGAGLSSFLDRALPNKVIQFTFTTKSKSKLGWDFLAVVETGRFKDWRSPQDGAPDEQALFWQQLEACQMEIIPGPEQRMRWGVPDGTRDHATGDFIHDDLVLSAALCAVLDGLTWGIGDAVILPAPDPLRGFSDIF